MVALSAACATEPAEPAQPQLEATAPAAEPHRAIEQANTLAPEVTVKNGEQ